MTYLMHPEGHIIVGLQDDSDGSLRVYLDHRSTGLHTHVDDEKAQAELRSAWGASFMGHLTTQVPATALCKCEATS